MHIVVEGVVQGVGFRPTAHRIATDMRLTGSIENTVDGVHIQLAADRSVAGKFIDRIRAALPPMARIDSVRYIDAPFPSVPTEGFVIRHSAGTGALPTQVSPDVAICPKCLDDMWHHPRRKGYFLTNCTECGPRFSIINALPYDRPLTSMARFKMCPSCAREYSDPADRRFHAQPVACLKCGPRYSMHLPDGTVIHDPDAIVSCTLRCLADGLIVTMKGTGGYTLWADALNEAALSRLRSMKHRPRKPFAVMCRDVEGISRFATPSRAEAEMLGSWRTPITLLRLDDGVFFPANLAPGCASIGVMLPYMGFHHALFYGNPALIAAVTSANRPGMPIMTADDDAVAYATEHQLPLVTFDRDIINRSDDSVTRIIADEAVILRRSRGYVPEAVSIDTSCHGIMGMGADITSQWALGRGHDIIQSQYIGSLTGREAEQALMESVAQLTSIYRITPHTVVCDAHPNYASARLAREYAASRSASLIPMWHHHAHAVSVMAEYGLEGEVLALVLDGTGAGPDGTIWGSELLVCSRTDFRRLAHGPYLPMPGGDKAATQPWRMAVAVARYIDRQLPDRLIRAVGSDRISIIDRMIRQGINCPLSCGAGRLWDAVAALLGVAYTNGYEAEAPVLLEGLASVAAEPYPEAAQIDMKRCLEALTDDIAAGTDRRVIASRFHATYSQAWVEEILRQSAGTGIRTIVLSGGVTQNRLITESIFRALSGYGISVCIPRRTPPGDAGIAVGQIAYAAALCSKSNQ